MAAARAEPDEQRRANLVSSATRLLGRELAALIRRGKAREMAMLPIDPANIHGIARCQIATGLKKREDGQVDDATALLDAGLITYDDILRMLDPNTENDDLANLFWLVTLERIAAASEVYWANPGNLTKVVSLMIQLEVQGIPASWVPQFDTLKRRCKQQLAELGSPWEDAANN